MHFVCPNLPGKASPVMHGDDLGVYSFVEGSAQTVVIAISDPENISYDMAIGTLPLDVGNSDLLVIAVLGLCDFSYKIIFKYSQDLTDCGCRIYLTIILPAGGSYPDLTGALASSGFSFKVSVWFGTGACLDQIIDMAAKSETP